MLQDEVGLNCKGVEIHPQKGDTLSGLESALLETDEHAFVCIPLEVKKGPRSGMYPGTELWDHHLIMFY